MSVAVLAIQPSDWARACTIHFDTMAREHVFVDESFPRHWTTTGRQAALLRHKPGITHDSVHHLKLVDESLRGVDAALLGTAACDTMIGYGRWQIKQPGMDMSYLSRPFDLGDWWQTDHDKRFVAWLYSAYHDRRWNKLMQSPLDQALYCVDMLAVMPGFQGRGAGDAFMKWGIEQADRHGALCTVESALSAEGFYLKYGFRTIEHVRFVPPPEFSDKGTQEINWMVREPTAASFS